MKAGWKWMVTILNFQEERTAGKSRWEKGSGRREPKTHPEGEQKPAQCFSGLNMTEAAFHHRAAVGWSSTHLASKGHECCCPLAQALGPMPPKSPQLPQH